jgi:hypothetical protein
MKKKILLLLIPLIILGFSCKTNDEINYDDYLDSGMIVPVLLTPENGSTASENPPTLTWERGQYVNYYQIQVSDNESFEGIIYAEINKDEGATASYTLDSALSPATYYWRVRSAGDPGG